jgi:endonuclease/exonuclease/phosphatase family metal-dependent hydrolase
MKFLSYNIQYGVGKDNKNDIDRIIAEIKSGEADVIALQELDRYWPRSGYTDQVERVTSALADYYWVYGPGVDLHADAISTENKGARRQFGNLVLSRFPIISSRHHLLPKYGSTGPLSLQRSAIEATILCGQQLLRVYSVHLTHLSSATRLPQIDRLLEIHHNAERDGFPVSADLTAIDWETKDWESGVGEQSVATSAIIMGDFNCQPNTEEYSRMVGPLCDYGGRINNPAGFVDAWTQCGGEELAGGTCEHKGNMVRFDYCFVSTSLRQQIKSCRVDEAAQGSDHQPLWTEIDF